MLDGHGLGGRGSGEGADVGVRVLAHLDVQRHEPYGRGAGVLPVVEVHFETGFGEVLLPRMAECVGQ